MVELGKRYASTCSEDRLQLDTLAGQVQQSTTDDPLFRQKLVYFVVEPDAVATKVAALLGRDPSAP
jgi:hypothetical protein